MENFSALGLMSGSSLDGVDLAYCSFSRSQDKWDFEIVCAETIPYPEEWLMNLKGLPEQDAESFIATDITYAKYLGDLVLDFCSKHQIQPQLLASHGHTIFHNPNKGYTCQIGNGQALASQTRIKTISDFRTKDILMGGQGAPLVPIGDQLLFSDFDFCLNLGGIANISCEHEGQRIAMDICGANQLLNHLSLQMGQAYDKDGQLAQLGKLDKSLFDKLNADHFFKSTYPKSLNNQYVQQAFIQLLDRYDTPLENKLYTAVKHIAFQVNQFVSSIPKKSMLITGGGAHNGFLVQAIIKETMLDITLPEAVIIDFKEAVVFAFMGVLRDLGETNCLASATAATTDSSCGSVFIP